MREKFDIRESGTLDHGVLNLPLKQRSQTLFGETRAQFDRRVAAEEKAARRERKALLNEAKALVSRVSDERMAELGKPHGMTVKQVRKQWLSMADMQPQNVIRVMRKELGL